MSVISSCLTSRQQSSDININKEFKESLRIKYIDYWIDESNIEISKSAITKWIDESWYSGSVITNKIIFNSFTNTGISNPLDGGEDDKFRGNEDIEREKRLLKLKMMSFI